MNICGFPIAPRAIIIASALLSSILCLNVSGVNTSPLPITGMFTLSLTVLIISQFAFPLYPCFCVLPWTAIAAAPAFSASFATCTALMCFSSIPILIFTVTGLLTALASLFTNVAICSGCLSISLPAPVLMTFHAGHPQFTSIMSKCFSNIFAASIMSWTFVPNSWTAAGFSIGSVRMLFIVFVFARVIAVPLTNSVYVSPAPYFLHNVLNATSVMPDIGLIIAGLVSFGNAALCFI